jgi:hypothetical protein
MAPQAKTWRLNQDKRHCPEIVHASQEWRSAIGQDRVGGCSTHDWPSDREGKGLYRQAET